MKEFNIKSNLLILEQEKYLHAVFQERTPGFLWTGRKPSE